MQCRMQVILRAVRTFCGCVSIIEKLKPSGASEEDIVSSYYYNIIDTLNLFFIRGGYFCAVEQSKEFNDAR